MKYEPVKILLAKGDIIKSKYGMLNKSPVSDEFYLVYEAEYLGDGVWRAIKKEEAEAKEASK